MNKRTLTEKINSIYNDIVENHRELRINDVISQKTFLKYPLRDTRIKDRLMGPKKTSSIYGYLQNDDDDKGSLNFIHGYLKYITDQTFNPRKFYEPRVTYWIKPDEVMRKITKHLFLAFDNEFIHGHIFYVGDKGSGKTLAQNCWLDENNTLLEEKKIFWVRCDGHKFYKHIWFDKDADADKLITLEQYLNIQFAYVFIKYYIDNDENSKASNFFEQIFNLLEEQTFDKQVGKQFDNKAPYSIVKQIATYHQDIIGWERNRAKKEPDASYAIFIMKEAQAKKTAYQRAMANWINLSSKIQEILIEKEYYFLKIIDGIDNIDLVNLDNLAQYKRLLKETAKFIYVKEPNVLKFIALRERTMIEIETISNNERKTQNDSVRPVVIWHTDNNSNLDFKEIFKKRLDYIFKKLREAKITNKNTKLIFFAQRYSDNLTADPNINKLYHNNVALYLRNNLSLLEAVYYRWLQLGEIEEFDFVKQADNFRNRNLFLNGRFFIDSTGASQDSFVRNGTYSHNLLFAELNYEAKEMHLKWQGLCNIRLIQLLKVAEYFSEERVVDYLKRHFLYSEANVRKAIALSKEYGLIDTEFNVKLKKVYLKTNKKGEYVLDLIFGDLDVLYAFALDSYIPEIFLDSKYIVAHSNKVAGKGISTQTDYSSATIKTVISFIIFIIHIENYEKEHFQSIEGLDYQRHFTLPLYKNKTKIQLRKRIVGLYNNASIKEKKNIDKFFDGIIAISEKNASVAKPPPPTEGISKSSAGGTVYNIHIDKASGLAIGDGAKVDLSPENDEPENRK